MRTESVTSVLDPEGVVLDAATFGVERQWRVNDLRHALQEQRAAASTLRLVDDVSGCMHIHADFILVL